MNPMTVIRSYREEDRSAVRRIACDTAFMGKPAEVFFDGREVLADILTGYFTDCEPESCFVAEQERSVIGYLIGAKDARRIPGISVRKILPAAILRTITGGTLSKKKNIAFLAHFFLSLLRGEFKRQAVFEEYPATMHINIDARFRGSGIGAQLLRAYDTYLEHARIAGVHLATLSPAAGRFFEKNGFRLLDTSRRTYFKYRTPGQAQWCFRYGKKIGG